MSVRTFTMLVTGVAATIMVAQGCDVTSPNARHCNNNDGDAYCNRVFGDGVTTLYCEHGGTPECRTSDYGCVEQRPADACYSPCGGRSTVDENGECVVVEDSSSGSSSGGTDTGTTDEPTGSESSSTTGPMPCSDAQPCTDVTAPYCNASGVCVPCNEAPQPEDGDAACAAADSDTPVCLDGTCVQCTEQNAAACANPTPVCDPTSNECVVCSAHDQCGPAACNLFTGACLPADAVVHVGGDPKLDLPNFGTIGEAVMSFAADGAQGTIIVHTGDYNNQPVTVDTNRVIAFLAADAAAMPPRWTQGAGGSPQLEVMAGSTVLLDGIQVSGNASSDVPGLRVNGGQAWLDRSRIVQNTGGGIRAQNGAELTLRNCFVGQVSDVVSLDVVDSSAVVLYSTIATSTFGATPALRCSSPVDIDIRNSIIVSQGGTPPDEISCPMAVTYSATEGLVAGDGNDDVGPFPPGMMHTSWFVNYPTGDFHLQNQGLTVFDGIAQWTAGDPTTDIDGDPRETVALDYAGADVPPK